MKLYILLAALGVVVFLLGLKFVDPAPPRRLTLAAGMKGGAYEAFGEKYKAYLAREGIQLEVRQTSGSIENLQLLKEGAADIAFSQTGVGNVEENPNFRSIASLGFEPLWIFYKGAEIKKLTDLRQRKIAIGDSLSGTNALMRRLLADNAMENDTGLELIGGGQALDALRAGTVDAACFVLSGSAPLVRELLRDESLRQLSLDRVAAYPALHPYLSSQVLPEGVMDLAKNIPPHDMNLVAPVMTLVARDSFHPALAGLLLRAAAEIHGPRGLFNKAGQFPSVDYVEFPIAEDTPHFLNHGPSFLTRHLPFWAATAIERMSFLVLPLATLLIPLFKLAPPLYVWKTRRQIYRWYAKLVRLEMQLRLARSAGGQKSGEDPQKIRRELGRLDGEVARVKVPLSYMDELYSLRSHILLVLDEAAEKHAGP